MDFSEYKVARGPGLVNSYTVGQVLMEEKTMEPLQSERPPLTAFEKKLRDLINEYCMENSSGTPDFILAEFLSHSLKAFTLATRAREHWYGRRTL